MRQLPLATARQLAHDDFAVTALERADPGHRFSIGRPRKRKASTAGTRGVGELAPAVSAVGTHAPEIQVTRSYIRSLISTDKTDALAVGSPPGLQAGQDHLAARTAE